MQFTSFIQCLTNQIAIDLVWRGEEIRIVKTLLRWLSDKEPACQCRRCGLSPWAGKTPWRREWQPTPVFFPAKCYGQRSLVGCSPWDCEDLHTTEPLNNNKNSHKTSSSQGRRLKHMGYIWTMAFKVGIRKAKRKQKWTSEYRKTWLNKVFRS